MVRYSEAVKADIRRRIIPTHQAFAIARKLTMPTRGLANCTHLTLMEPIDPLLAIAEVVWINPPPPDDDLMHATYVIAA